MSTTEEAPRANGAPDKPNDGGGALNENENPTAPPQDVPPPPGDSDPHQQQQQSGAPPQGPSQVGTTEGPPHADLNPNPPSSTGEPPQQPPADAQMWHSGAGAPGQPPGAPAPGYATYYGAPPPGHHGHAPPPPPPPHGHHPHPGPHGHHHPDAPYYQQFANMNVQTQAHEVMRNSYTLPYRPTNDDPEIAQAMLNLGSETGGGGSGAGPSTVKNGQGAPGVVPAPAPGGAPPNGIAPGPGVVPGAPHHPHQVHPAGTRMMMPGPPPPVGQGQAPPGSVPGQHPAQQVPHSPSGHHQGAPPPPPPGHYYPPPPPHGHVPHAHHHYYPHPSQMEHDPSAYYNMQMRGGEMAGPPGVGPPMGQHPQPHGHPHAGNGAQPKPQVKPSEMYHPKPETTEKKRKRPADMPRRPLSAYNFFFSEERVHVLNSIPDPVDKDAAADGTAAPQASKPAESKEEIEKKASSTAERLLNIRDAKNVKRRPHRKSHGKIAFKDLARTIGQRWRALTEEGKQKYNALAEKDLQRYNEQMKEYNSKRNRFSVSYQTTPGPLPPQLNAAVIQQTNELRDVSVGGNVPPRAVTGVAPGSELAAPPPGIVMNPNMVGPPGPVPVMHGHPPPDNVMQVPMVMAKDGHNIDQGDQNKAGVQVGANAGDAAAAEDNLNVTLNVGETPGADVPQAPGDVLV